jgi:hypothetical protein
MPGGTLLALGFLLPLASAQSPAPDATPAQDPDAPVTIATDDTWRPFDYNLDINAGSVFDFSALNDAPAGKYGPVIVTPSGHFEFKNRPGVRVKFWGVNICTQALYMDKASDDAIAQRLRRSGYNVVRIHHFDRDLLTPGGNSYDIDPAQLDKLEYFISALEKQGIYFNIDLFTLRNFSDAEAAAFGWPGPDQRKTGFDRLRWYKATMPISDAAFDSWKKFSQNLLTHRNPYTGLTWAEDPALIGICPLNEDTLAAQVKKVPPIASLYEDKFTAWRQDPKNQDYASVDEASAYNEFLLETEMANDTRMRQFLRSIGVQAPVTGCNYIDSEVQAYLRGNYDYVDDHDYWDMPVWLGHEWSLPFKTGNKDPVKALAEMPRTMMDSRVFGKPFTVTEYSYVWPTADRAAGGVLMSTYASLQDWDAIYYFAYAGKPDAIMTPLRSGILDLAPDPVNLLADRLAALIFRRGDVKPAPHAVCYAVEKPDALKGAKGDWHGFPKGYDLLGLVTRIGNSTAQPDSILGSDTATQTGLSAVVTTPNSASSGEHVYHLGDDLASRLTQDGILPASPDRHYTSETGQVDLSRDSDTLKAVTDRSECFTLPPQEKVDGHFVSVENGATLSTVSVVAVDDKPLADSNRILVLHLTDSLNLGSRFKTAKLDQLEAWGDLPHMVRQGETDVTFHITTPGNWQAWAVDASGNRLGPVDLERAEGGFLLKADTFYKDGTCLAYELVRNGS